MEQDNQLGIQEMNFPDMNFPAMDFQAMSFDSLQVAEEVKEEASEEDTQ